MEERLWFGIAAPAKTPRDITEHLGKEVGEITKLPDLRKKMSALGYDLDYADSERFRDLIAGDHKRYGAVIREAGISPNQGPTRPLAITIAKSLP